MPESTKIIPFPSRAKPRTIQPKSRIAEFAAVSETIVNKRDADTAKRLAPATGSADIIGPSRLT